MNREAAASERDTRRLRQAFDSFSRASNSLEKAYAGLQAKVRRLSRELEESNDYLESVLQSLPCGVVVVDGGRVTTINERARELLGVGHPVSESRQNGAQRDASEDGPGSLLTSRGSRPPLPTTLEALLELIPAREAVERLFRGRRPPREIEVESPAPRTLSCAWSQMKRGERVLVLQDITELRELQEKVRRRDRLAAMGEMAFEVAHEIRNPLTGLGLFASLLREDGLSAEERGRYADNIEIGIRALDVTLTNMLCFSRRPQPELRPLDLSKLISEIIEFMRPVAEERGIVIETDFEGGAAVDADEEMLRQALTNLVLNALQALPEGARLEASVRSGEAGRLVVCIRDSGIGLEEDAGGSAFEPSFKTTEKGRGLGLGIVKKVVEAHQGEVKLKSGRRWGTEFTLLFPPGEKAA